MVSEVLWKLRMVSELVLELSFRDNARPSEITLAIRDRLVSRQKRVRWSVTSSIIGAALLFDVGVAAVLLNSSSTMPFQSVLAWEAIAVALMLLATWIWHLRRIAFLQEAPVTAAAVMESHTTALWGIGGIPSWMKDSGRNAAEALDEEEGQSEDVLYVTRVRLRFRPGWTSEQLNWNDLRDEVPHIDVTKWLLSGAWGTFASGLKRGALVSLLYSPENPRDCRIVQQFHSKLPQV